MRTKGSVSSVAINLHTLNKVLKPTAEIMVSKKFYDAISMLINKELGAIEDSQPYEAEAEEQSEPIYVESL